MRVRALVAATAWLFAVAPALADDIEREPGMGPLCKTLGLGDYGYKHLELHTAYQELSKRLADATPLPDETKKALGDAYGKIFGSGRCHCSTGQCRPTTYRSDEYSPTGVDLFVDGKWCAVPKSAFLSREELKRVGVPEILMMFDAHVCASDSNIDLVTGCPTIECGIVLTPD